jgi:hypothetical protein
LLFEKGIITDEEIIAKFKKLDREMKERKAGKYFKMKLNPCPSVKSID